MTSIEKVPLSKIFPDPPLDVGFPDRVIVYSKTDVIRYMNQLNGKVRLFVSLYSNNNPKIDKVWFDFDSERAYDNAVKFHEWCKVNNYRHMVVISGGGFHCTIFTKGYEKIVDPKVALQNAHKTIAQEVGLTIGDEKIYDIDYHIVGDIRRIYSIVGTYNCKRMKWVTSLTGDELMSGMDNIKNIASKQRQCIYIMGDEYYDVDKFKDCKSEYSNIHIPDTNNSFVVPDADKEILEMFPPCIQRVLLDIEGTGGFRGRYLFTVWAKELGMTQQQTDEIAKRFFSRVKRTDRIGTNWDHYKKVKTSKLIYERDEMLPSCEKVFVDYDRVCSGRCKWYLKQMKDL